MKLALIPSRAACLEKPIYDCSLTYEENFAKGPFFDLPLIERQESSLDIDFLGQRLASSLGVAAGPLLHSAWIKLASRLGFDLLTYKTIRSREKKSHPLPNMLFIEADKPFERGNNLSCRTTERLSLSVTNSFGMPSKPFDFLEEDIALAQSYLLDKQALIVSVVGSEEADSLSKDYAFTASLAAGAGAKLIEANFSCPNVQGKQGAIYTDPVASYEVAKGITQAIDLPLIVKLGALQEEKQIREVFIALARAGVQAVSGINTVKAKIEDAKGQPALKDRLEAGVCGAAIQSLAKNFLRLAVKVNKEEKLGLKILAGGGILTEEDIASFLDLGADLAMVATGMIWDPYLAYRYKKRRT